MTNIVKFQPVEVGKDFRFDPDVILEAAKGKGFINLIIIGEHPEGGRLWVSGLANAGESLILMELAKLQIIGKEL